MTAKWCWFQNGLQCNGRRCWRQQGDVVFKLVCNNCKRSWRQQGDVGFPQTTSLRRTHRSHRGTDPMRPDTIFERFFITSFSQGRLPILNWIWHILVRTIFLLGRGNKTRRRTILSRPAFQDLCNSCIEDLQVPDVAVEAFFTANSD